MDELTRNIVPSTSPRMPSSPESEVQGGLCITGWPGRGLDSQDGYGGVSWGGVDSQEQVCNATCSNGTRRCQSCCVCEAVVSAAISGDHCVPGESIWPSVLSPVHLRSNPSRPMLVPIAANSHPQPRLENHWVQATDLKLEATLPHSAS
jgi:hypothetical protein